MITRSQNGWTANERSLCSWFSVPGSNVRLLLRTQYAGPLLIAFLTAFHRRVEALQDPGCWSYAPRMVRGSVRVVSNHASGTAVDVNAPRHPLGARGTFSDDDAREIHRLLRVANGTIRWGGDYRGRADEMHFELHSTNIAEILKATRALRRETNP
jgi:hypothetical protein